MGESCMSDVKVTPIHKLGQDERGETYEFKTKKTGDFMLIQRKAGSISGNSYHEGKNPGTAPKTFIVLSGRLEFSYRHVDSDDVRRLIIGQPSIIEVQPRVTHAVKALTDFTMLEANSVADIREDRVMQVVDMSNL